MSVNLKQEWRSLGCSDNVSNFPEGNDLSMFDLNYCVPKKG